MRKLLLLPFLFALACEPDHHEYQYPPAGQDTISVEPVPVDTVPPAIRKPGPADFSASQLPDAVEDAVPDFCRRGQPCDIAGDPVKARTVDPRLSTFHVLPPSTLFSPGDKIAFNVCANTKPEPGQTIFDSKPIEGLPVIVVAWTGHRRLAGDGTTLTGADGCVKIPYTVQTQDMMGDPSDDEPDNGSLLVLAYVGGRLLDKKEGIWDTW